MVLAGRSTGMDSSPQTDRTTVLIIEDEPGLADLYAAWLAENYDVRTAYSGTEGLEKIDDQVGVILLDRRMPGVCGDRLLESIRADGYDGYVALVSAIEPDVDVVDVEFDDYLVKPVSQNDLNEGVERLLAREQYDESVGELFSLLQKRTILESREAGTEIVEHPEFQELCDKIERLTEQADDLGSTLEDEDLEILLRRIEREAIT